MKLKHQKNAKKILSDKIADALTVKPRADIEDDQVFGTKPKTVSRDDLGSSDSEDEATISNFRKENVNLLSEVSRKYEGKVVSRKDPDEYDDEVTSSEENVSSENIGKQAIFSDSESEGQLDNELKYQSDGEDSNSLAKSDDYNITKLQKLIHGDESDNNDEEGDDNEDDNDEGDSDEDDNDDEGYDISQMDEPMKENFEHVKKQNVSEEAKKGISVRSQLLLWEGLLEMRIHLQRCMNTANQMPLSETYNSLKDNNEFLEEITIAKSNVTTVLDKMMLLQNLLLKKYPETKALCSSSNPKNQEEGKQESKESDEEIPSDTDNEEIPSDTEEEDTPKETKPQNTNTKSFKKRKLEEYENELSKSYKAFKPFRDSSIQKWNDKVRLATASNIKNVPTNSVLQQISYILSDKEKLVRRTQLKRSEYDIIGYKKAIPEDENDQNESELKPVSRDWKDNDEYISEIFDDSDFYHQLLRELIECKSADVSDPIQLSRQWIALQQMRSKMKRKVDTKATKGRKIKYVVHNQLVNFMAPEKNLTWTDESRNELYSSLFGKMFEQNNVGIDVGNGFKIKD